MNDWLTNLISRILDLSVGPGEGTSWSVDYQWSWAPWLTLMIAALVLGWVSYFYFRESSAAGRAARTFLIFLRCALFVVLALMISQIMLSLHRTGLPTLVVVVDNSLSMGIVDTYEDKQTARTVTKLQGSAGKPTRFELLKSVLAGRNGLLEDVGRQYKLKLFAVNEQALEIPGRTTELSKLASALKLEGGSTRLGDAVRSILADLRGVSPAAMVILSDGITTQGETLSDIASEARSSGTPLFTIAIGSEQPVRDLELTDLIVDDIVFADDIVNFQFTLKSSGLRGKKVQIVLHEKDKQDVLAEANVELTDIGNQRATVTYRPTTVGDFDYVVEAKPLAGELNSDNNSQSCTVAVRKEKIRVLLVQAYPNYEFRYLRNMLGRDSTIQLNTVLQEADAGFAQTDETALPVFPVLRDQLFQYDVIIFGDVNPAFLSAGSLEALSDFVEKKGGGLIVVAGPLYTPGAYQTTSLAKLLPVTSVPTLAQPTEQQESFAVQPTELGLATPQMQLGDTLEQSRQIWRNLPELQWLAESPKVKPAARVLAEHPTRTDSDGRKLPVFCAQYVGAGQVLFHATDETWRWRYRVGDVYFARYWIQAIRALSRFKLLGKDRPVDLTTDRRQYAIGDPVHLRVRYLDETQAPADEAGVTAMLEQKGRPQRRVQLARSASGRGLFEATLPNAGIGKYHAWLGPATPQGKSPAVDFQVVAPPGEFQRTTVDAADLARAAQETGGRFYRLTTVSNLPTELPAGHQVPIETLPPYVLWNRWWLLAMFLLLLTSEWILRKRKGML